MKHNKKFETWAMKVLVKAQKVLLLQSHKPLVLHFGCQNKNAHSEFQFAYPYKTLQINYSDAIVKDFLDGKKEEVKAVLIHEMCHAITDPFYAKATTMWTTRGEIEDERENLTDHIANVVLANKLV